MMWRLFPDRMPLRRTRLGVTFQKKNIYAIIHRSVTHFCQPWFLNNRVTRQFSTQSHRIHRYLILRRYCVPVKLPTGGYRLSSAVLQYLTMWLPTDFALRPKQAFCWHYVSLIKFFFENSKKKCVNLQNNCRRPLFHIFSVQHQLQHRYRYALLSLNT